MKQLGLVRAGSRRERSAMSKSEARKFINQLIAHPRIRQKASELRPHEDISGYVIDHDLSPCQVVLSVRADSPLSLQHKQAKRGFPEEIPSGPVWVDKFGLSSTRTRSLLGHADADKAVYSYSGTHYPRWRTCRWQGRIGARGASPQSSIL